MKKNISLTMKPLGLLVFCLLSFSSIGFAQDSLAVYRLDERNLNSFPETSIVNDPSAHRGKAMFRPASASAGTFWYGPYKHFQAGNYLIQFRLKVSSNVSTANLININAASLIAGFGYGVDIKPSMFRNSNEWQLFTIPVQITENITDLEIRGIDFRSGITDLYMDYITIMPGDFRSMYSNEFSIDGKGNMGIGTIDPKGYKLAIAGNMIAESVKVQLRSGWADYVFAKDYSLPTLEETEKHIKENGHLPGIPSAAEVKSNGIDLGEMNARLLEKIEQLTLYLIEQKKELDQVKADNIKLNKKVFN